MASLDLLDYLQGLDAALAPALAPALRRQALRDARRVIDAMAFRFALMDERPMPEDLDYLRALEAVKPPARAAPALLARAPHYRRVRARRLGTTFVTLGIVGLAIAGLAWLATSESSQDLATLTYATIGEETRAIDATFTITPEMDRIYLAGTIFVSPDSTGSIDVYLTGPDQVPRLIASYADRGTYYLRENEYDPAAGDWTLLVDFNDVRGSAHIEVSGVLPTR